MIFLRRLFVTILFIPILILSVIITTVCLIVDTFVFLPLSFLISGDFTFRFRILTLEFIQFWDNYFEFRIK